VNNFRDYTSSEDNYRVRLFQNLFSTNFGAYPIMLTWKKLVAFISENNLLGFGYLISLGNTVILMFLILNNLRMVTWGVNRTLDQVRPRFQCNTSCEISA
jgi:hypothetical protein